MELVLYYVEAFTEILKQEEAMKVEFDTIIDAVGSGGTYAGLYIGNELNRTKKQIIGYIQDLILLLLDVACI